eukprot:CAMPEP_0194271362 /NCGR_PEP_ID=MMETSP0169-20130528/5162_1 /TAXON_ID=218684 /ORGANISM="Corethron pennatum, Strain L29A3" /LENGTH=437 /DNA_ID=CAMNT_0039013689 /DNA_START=160 /DNA_END=1472 /DNA_ORIENTATION=-
MLSIKTVANTVAAVLIGVVSVNGSCALKPKEDGSVSIPYGTKSIRDKAFWGCKELKSVIIPLTVEKIASYAFFASGIETITFDGESQLQYIGLRAFGETKELRAMNIPATVKEFGIYAFSSSALEEISFDGDGLKIIGFGAFWMSNLKTINIPQGIEIDFGDFYGIPCADKSNFTPGTTIVDCKVSTEGSVQPSVQTLNPSREPTSDPTSASTPDRYVLQNRNKNSCPMDYIAITDAKTCKRASAYLQIKYLHVKNGGRLKSDIVCFVTDVDSKGRLGPDSASRLNSNHFSGSAWICQSQLSTSNPIPELSPNPTLELTSNPTVEPTFNPTLEPTPNPTLEPTLDPTSAPTIKLFVMQKRKLNSCPTGYVAIKDAQTCKRASAYLKIKYKHTENGGVPGSAIVCFVTDINYNQALGPDSAVKAQFEPLGKVRMDMSE